MPKVPMKATNVRPTRAERTECADEAPPRVGDYLAAALGAGWPGSPMPANRSAADFVEQTLCLFLRLRPEFECRRCRRFQV
jgi:hypothetical protein